MTVKELRALLLKLDPTERLEVVATAYSDYHELEESEVTVVRGVKRWTTQYVERWHYTMSAKDQADARQFILLAGN